MRNSRPSRSCTLADRFALRAAVLIIAKSLVGHPLESLPVSSPQNTMPTCIIILQTGGSVLTFRRIVAVSYSNSVGALPPQIK